MADPRMPNEEQWRTQAYRMKIVQKLEDAMRNCPNPMPKTSAEMEEFVFRKSRTMEEYLDFVARVLLSVQEQKKKAAPGMGGQQAGNMGGAGGPVMVGGPSGMGGPNTGMEGPGGSMGGPGTSMAGGGMGGPGGGMVGPGSGMVGPGGGMGGPPGSMAGSLPPQGGQDPINALTNLAGQGAAGMGRQQPGMMHPMGGPQMMDQSLMMRAPRMRAQIPQKPTQLTRQDAFMVTSPQTMPGVQGQALPSSSASMVYQGPGGPVRSMGPMGMPQQYMQGRDVSMGAMPVQSPAQGSPVTMMPSPHQPGMMPSPMMRPPMGAGVPSPSTMLHTPGTAYADPSPGPPSQSQEEREYHKKLEKLSKYIEPLRKLLPESEKKTDEESKKKNQKIQHLLDILSNKRRIPIDVLEKCEQVLVKLTSSGGSSSSNGHMCQPLLDAVAHFSSATFLNHSLYRTFGPALEAYMGPPIKAPSPPPSRKRKLEKETSEELPDVLQGEIARLGSRFIVSVDSRKHAGSDTHHLVCKLEDPRLPSVPPLLVTIPKNYPKDSPQCEPSECPGYDSTEFFQNVEKNLTVHLSNMPNRFCLTQVLTSWEMSVRKACDPKNPQITHRSSIFL